MTSLMNRIISQTCSIISVLVNSEIKYTKFLHLAIVFLFIILIASATSKDTDSMKFHEYEISFTKDEKLMLVHIDTYAIKSGSGFNMGSSKLSLHDIKIKFGDPMYGEEEHFVNLSGSFFIGKFEVTQAQFSAFVLATGYKTESEICENAFGWNSAKKKFETNKSYSWKSPGFPQGVDHPVVAVSWHDATMFSKWFAKLPTVSKQISEIVKTTRWECRLPSEAQWEFACRGGTETLFSFGNSFDDIVNYGNVADLSGKDFLDQDPIVNGNDGFVYTSPVGKYKSNLFGLCDMHGNVAEWCEDYLAEYTNDKESKDEPLRKKNVFGEYHVVRGGSWYSNPGQARSACRYAYKSSASISTLGFRICIVLK